MQEKQYDVLVVGELNLDLILNGIDKFPEIGKEVLAQKMTLTLGSSSAIFASNLATLGSRVRFCGSIGKDDFGEKILSDLAERNVDCSAIIRSDTADTGITVALNIGEDRAMITYPGAMNELREDHITDDMLLSARHLHISSIFLQPALKTGLISLLKRAKQFGLTTSLDPQWDPAELWNCELREMLISINIFLPNLEEIKNLTGTSSMYDALKALENEADQIVVKNGHAGATLWLNKEMQHQEPFLNTSVVDAIGAGDSFDAGYIHQYVQGKTSAECLAFAALCGAINTTAMGGTGAFADYKAVKTIALSKFNVQL